MTQIRDLATHGEATVTVDELADFWRVDPRVIYRDISKGALTARKIGRAYRILIADARAYGRPDGVTAPVAAVR
jgi:hypothetical protein